MAAGAIQEALDMKNSSGLSACVHYRDICLHTGKQENCLPITEKITNL
jgi:hypothetical protein